jgi:hypothetical protein
VKAKEIITANCSKQNYTSIPPYFPKLNSLNFSHNHIREVRSVNFKNENFRDTQNIDLSYNEIQNIETQSFKHLTQLRYLNLSYNKITSVSSALFMKLKMLADLDLHGNSIDCVALKNELPWVNILCSSSEEYAYDTTTAAAAPTTASDSNMEITELSYTDDIMMTTVTLSRTESSNMTKRHSDSETVTKTHMNDTEMPITTSIKNYNITVFGVTQITHAVAADQQPSTVPAMNEDTNASPIDDTTIGIILVIVLGVIVIVIGAYGGMLWCRKHKYAKAPTDPEGQLQDESNHKKLFCVYSCLSQISTN